MTGWDWFDLWLARHERWLDAIQTFVAERRYVFMLLTGLALVWALRKAKARGAL